MAQRATPVNKSPSAIGRGRPTSGAPVSTAPVADARKVPRRDFVEALWNLFCSVRFAVVLNVVLALVAMLGTIIPQMPVGIENFPGQLDQFLSDAQSRYGDLSGPLYWAGAYDLYNSLPFRLLVVVVIFSIIICTLNRWQPIMRLIRRPAVAASDSFITGLSEKAQFRAVPLSEEEAEAALRQSLKKSRYRVLSNQSAEAGTVALYADRDRWSKLVTFVSHAALVAVILVAAGLARFGWREQSIYFYPGMPVNVGHSTDFQVRSDAFSIDYYPDGKTVREYKDTLSVIEGGTQVLTKTIVVNDPLHYKGVDFFLVSYQPVVFVKATDKGGSALPLRLLGQSGWVTDTNRTAAGETLVQFNQVDQSSNLPLDFVQLQVPGHFLSLQITYYQDVARADNENPPAYVKAYLDQNFDTPLYDGFMPRTGPLRLPGYEQYSFTFRKDTATVLEAAHDPGTGIVMVFFLIMAAGFTTSLYTSFVRCWAKVRPNPEKPGTVDIIVGGLAEKNKVSFERDFEKLAARIKDNLSEAARSVAGKQ